MRTRKRERESERVRVCVSERQIDSRKHTNMLLVQLLVERVLLRTPPFFLGGSSHRHLTLISALVCLLSFFQRGLS